MEKLNTLKKLDLSVLKVLSYFDIFKHPVTIQEIWQFADHQTSIEELKPIIERLVIEGKIKHQKQFYYLGDDSIVERREKGNKLANDYLKNIYQFSKRIARFPFVRGVSISGSLSKHYMDEYSDIDFFVIVKPGRVLFCRILFFLLLFKKIKKLLRKKVSCVNYFIDTEALHIPEHNIYIATEIATLIPVYNYSLYQKFMSANLWVNDYMPNFTPRYREQDLQQDFFFKKIVEWIFSGFIGNSLEYLFYNITIGKWISYIPLFFWLKHRKYKNKIEGYITHKERPLYYYTKHVFKHHPKSQLQSRVITLYYEKIKKLEKKSILTS